QESRLPPGSDFRRWVWITIAPFVTAETVQEYFLYEKKNDWMHKTPVYAGSHLASHLTSNGEYQQD
ncbi:hypothetical protein, partial [Escherichia coli]